MMNKSLITNLISIFIILIGFLYRDDFSFILLVGVFALSGSITNLLAIHMLFDKVPFLYGSGVILDRFDDIKLGIKNLILKELFSAEQIDKFILDNKQKTSGGIIEKIDFDRVFVGLVESIEGSQLGGMLAMIGGRKALEPLKDPFVKKIKANKTTVTSSQTLGYQNWELAAGSGITFTPSIDSNYVLYEYTANFSRSGNDVFTRTFVAKNLLETLNNYGYLRLTRHGPLPNLQIDTFSAYNGIF